MDLRTAKTPLPFGAGFGEQGLFEWSGSAQQIRSDPKNKDQYDRKAKERYEYARAVVSGNCHRLRAGNASELLHVHCLPAVSWSEIFSQRNRNLLERVEKNHWYGAVFLGARLLSSAVLIACAKILDDKTGVISYRTSAPI